MVYDLQKAGLWKRFAAWLFDFILVGVLTVGIAFLLSAVLGYDHHSETVSRIYEKYETQYHVTFQVTQAEYDGWTEEQRQHYDAAYEALTSDEEAMYAYNMVVNLTMLIASFSILLGMLLLELLVPIFLKNGQTLGKKIFGLCLVRTDCVRMSNLQLFVRVVLGKFAVETMIPVYVGLMIFWGILGFSGTILLGVLALGQGLCMLLSRKNTAVHDLLAGTVVADYGSQMIFESAEALVEYQKKLHAERAARQEY